MKTEPMQITLFFNKKAKICPKLKKLSKYRDSHANPPSQPNDGLNTNLFYWKKKRNNMLGR